MEPGKPLTLGVHFQIKPGWHTYWKNPGDSGEPLKLHWEETTGLAFGELEFPYPTLIKAGPLASYGFEKEAMFLVQVTPEKGLPSGKTVKLKAKATWLVCAEICLPEKGVFDLELPVENQAPQLNQAWQPKFEEARTKIPRLVPTKTVSFSQESSEGNNWLWLNFLPKRLGFSPSSLPKNWHFFPDQGGLIEAAAEQVLIEQGDSLRLRLQAAPLQGEFPSQLSGVLVGGDQAFQMVAQAQPSRMTFPWTMLGFAFLGGILLNLMPCVFPVLSIKVLSFVKKSHSHPQHLRVYGWMYTLGVLFSFWILTAILLILKQLGNQLGWGFQLQSPNFIVVLIFLFFLLGFSLLGVFEIGTRWMGLGSHLTRRQGYSGSFFTGVLATVVATPCMAPLMGPALGFALTQEVFTTWIILSALALGMATPYLLLCYLPQILKWLPKPGPWMETFKQFMAFPLFATVLWLLWVLSEQTGINSVFFVLGGLLLSGFALWSYQRYQQKKLIKPSLKPKGRGRRWIKLGPIFLILFLGIVLGFWGIQPKPLSNSNSANFLEPNAGWVPFSAEKLESLRATGEPVFLNFTAAWCLTCQVNERLIFQNPEVQQRFAKLGAVLMKGDWTRQDDAITKALRNYGRQGVPVYVWYARGRNTMPKVLPEILTQETLFRYLN